MTRHEALDRGVTTGGEHRRARRGSRAAPRWPSADRHGTRAPPAVHAASGNGPARRRPRPDRGVPRLHARGQATPARGPPRRRPSPRRAARERSRCVSASICSARRGSRSSARAASARPGDERPAARGRRAGAHQSAMPVSGRARDRQRRPRRRPPRPREAAASAKRISTSPCRRRGTVGPPQRGRDGRGPRSSGRPGQAVGHGRAYDQAKGSGGHPAPSTPRPAATARPSADASAASHGPPAEGLRVGARQAVPDGSAESTAQRVGGVHQRGGTHMTSLRSWAQAALRCPAVERPAAGANCTREWSTSAPPPRGRWSAVLRDPRGSDDDRRQRRQRAGLRRRRSRAAIEECS